MSEYNRIRPLVDVTPRTDRGKPEWFHHHGFKMSLETCDTETPLVVISATAARLEITHSPLFEKDSHPWFVSWRVVQYRPRGEQVDGKTSMKPEELRAAFGLTDDQFGEGHKWLIERYGATTAVQREFIRYKDFLNIPGPGTGHDGDPNISIVLDPRIKKAVGDIMKGR